MKPFLCAVALAVAGSAFAHDFWIEPSTFRPAPGQSVSASLRVGEKLQGDPVPRLPPLIVRFSLGARPMLGTFGADPAGVARVDGAGQHWIVYEGRASLLTLDAAKFEKYLREEGLERVIELRAKSGQSAAPGREHFYRCAKALLDAGGAPAFDTPHGLTLELIPRKNPYALRGDLPVTLLFRGKPAANVLVVARSTKDPEKTIQSRTDAQGRATLRLGHAGFWLIKAVHMEPAPPGSGVDWESWWASLTFDNSAR